ncbi:MAG: DEAD/DEAH box helicase family protein [Desulfobulbaceae bacterium]|nr:DEAD/DEAH box helicase family protein [Desulfobulbaceae bacterium]
MELLPYQQQVLTDLADFLCFVERRGELKEAFDLFWRERGVVKPEPYRNTIAQVPHVCIKVPTGGGKTFIAANAIKTIFDGLTIYMRNEPKAVVWLVPSNAILDQTEKNLSNPQHPYRRKVNDLFNGRVAVYTKNDLMQAAGFNATSVREHLNIFVLSYDSFRTQVKEGRKAYQENSNLDSFARQMKSADLLPDTDESALINVIRAMKPICIVDESHNATSKLSKEMLTNFNPSLILDLTATPREDSNIISYVDAAQLKTQHMVKLPVIVYNHHSRKEVISNAIQLRNSLEKQAIEQHRAGGDYIRPIVLFQAQPDTGKEEETTTFEDIKNKLVQLGIPEGYIAIKTATINEIKNEDLLSPTCTIRYIITINALKEGWDCPFAYILATIANRHSSVDVEQIVGRVLRQPYARSQKGNLLNNSYVLASSDNFIATLNKIVEGLNRAGFSEKDVRAKDATEQEVVAPVAPGARQPGLFGGSLEAGAGTVGVLTSPTNDDNDWPDPLPEINGASAEPLTPMVRDIIERAATENRQYEERAQEAVAENIADEVRSKMNEFGMVTVFADEAKKLRLPQFYMRVPGLSLFGGGEESVLFNKEELLRDFRLSQADSHIDFTTTGEAYQVDIEKIGDQNYRPSFWKLKHTTREQLAEYLIALPTEAKRNQLGQRLYELIGNMYPIADPEVKGYVRRILEGMKAEQLHDCIEREYSYRDKIKAKIDSLATAHADEVFFQWLAADRLDMKAAYELPPVIHPVETAPAIPLSLYSTEGKLNSLEAKVINEIANLENIRFWHRIVERKGFCINGFINIYPDFLVVTKRGKVLLIESKGDDRDNSDSIRKLKLGTAWANKAGNDYRYFMVFDTNPIAGAFKIDDLVKVVGQL